MPKTNNNIILGIDFGTTNSAMATMIGNQPEIIPNVVGARTTPSIISFTPDDHFHVGSDAKRQALINPHTIINIKNHMGDPNYKVSYKGNTYSASLIASMILKYLRASASQRLHQPINKAVITVPAYFNDNQRQATAKAGELAGLKVCRIINEPTAAALAYGLNHQNPQRIMVFDFGGGTLDVSILQLNSHGVFQVLSTNGNTKLGGNDFDYALMLFIRYSFNNKYHIDLYKKPSAVQRLRLAVEQAKIDLSSNTSTEISLPFIASSQNGPINLKMTITRKLFNTLTQNLVQKTRIPIDNALKDAGLKISDVNQIILNGGSTRIPAVRQALMKWSGKQLNTSINPDEAVALGAAIQGGMLSGTLHNMSLLDVTPMTLGVETLGHKFEPLIARNTTIPASKSEVFTTAVDGQDHFTIRVFQGESQNLQQDSELAQLELKNIPSAPAGATRVRVTFDIDKNGIVQVSAKDLSSGKKQQIKVSLDRTAQN